MTSEQKNNIVFRMLAGYVRCGQYRILYPSTEILYEATEVYKRVMDQYKYANFFTKKSILPVLYRHKIWTPDGEANLKGLSKSIEELKVKLFRTIGRKKDQDRIRKQLNATKIVQEKLFVNRHLLDYMTVEGLAYMASQRFVYVNTICDTEGKRLWPHAAQCDFFLLNHIMVIHRETALSVDQYREIARSEPWRSYWNARGIDIFGEGVLDDERKAVVLFSKMYDNAYEHPDCPKEDVVEDDDLFDGWLIFERRKREAEKEEDKRGQKTKPGSHRGADHNEFFEMVSTQGDADDVFGLNDRNAQARLRAKRTALRNLPPGQEIPEALMPDVRQENAQKAVQQFSQHVKNRKK